MPHKHASALRRVHDDVAAAHGRAFAIAQVQAQVRQRLLRIFVRRGLLSVDAAQAMAQWPHGGGFPVDASVRIEAADRAGRERLLRYCARPPFAPERLREVAPQHPLYASTKPGTADPDAAAATRPPRRSRPATTRSPLLRRAGAQRPLRAAVIALAPATAPTPPASVAPPPPATEPAPRRAARYAWALLLARIYAVFPLVRPYAPRGNLTPEMLVAHAGTGRLAGSWCCMESRPADMARMTRPAALHFVHARLLPEIRNADVVARARRNRCDRLHRHGADRPHAIVGRERAPMTSGACTGCFVETGRWPYASLVCSSTSRGGLLQTADCARIAADSVSANMRCFYAARRVTPRRLSHQWRMTRRLPEPHPYRAIR